MAYCIIQKLFSTTMKIIKGTFLLDLTACVNCTATDYMGTLRCISGPPLGGRLRVIPFPSVPLSVCPSVPCLCRLLNLPIHHCADVPFNWRRPAAATPVVSRQQACCVSLCTLSGRASVVLATTGRHTCFSVFCCCVQLLC